jgi:hypothetical protein
MHGHDSQSIYLLSICFPFGQQKKHNPYQVVLCFAWQRPTLTGTKSQLPSALRSLTSVFGMGTGVTFSPLLPDYFFEVSFPQN